jgi:tetrahydrodipicolinate N-acetyltransferase
MSRNSNYEQPAKFHQPSDVPVAAKYPSLPNAPDDISSAESGDRHPPAGEFWGDNEGPSTTVRKVLKVLGNPRLAAVLLNAQLSIRGKAWLPLSVRLSGRIRFRGDGDVEFGQGVCLVGDVVPIEIVSYKGSHVSIGDHTFINYGSSITAYEQVKIGRHCLLGHHLLIVDRNEHGVEQRELAPPAAPVIIEDHVWIGSHAIILPGVHIGRHAAIGAGSVVTKDVPANCLAVGNPARVVRQFDTGDAENIEEFSKTSLAPLHPGAV